MYEQELRELYGYFEIDPPTDPLDMRQEIMSDLIPATISNFSHDIVVEHAGHTDAARTRLFGRDDYTQGDFYERMTGAALVNMPEATAKLIGSAASMLAQQMADSPIEIPHFKPPRIDPHCQTLHFDDEVLGIARRPEVIVDLRPGIQGLAIIDQQIDDSMRMNTPLTHHSVTNSFFTSIFLEGYWRANVGEPAFSKNIKDTFFTSDASGMPTIEASPDANEEADVDLVLAARMGMYSLQDVEYGLKGAYYLLRPGGALFLQGAEQKQHTKFHDSDVIMSDLIDIAGDAGFDVKNPHFVTSQTGRGSLLSTVLVK